MLHEWTKRTYDGITLISSEKSSPITVEMLHRANYSIPFICLTLQTLGISPGKLVDIVFLLTKGFIESSPLGIMTDSHCRGERIIKTTFFYAIGSPVSRIIKVLCIVTTG